MKALLALLVILTTGFSASALTSADLSTETRGTRTETRCWFNDCLKEGWKTTQWGSSMVAETQCIEKDCANKGWVTDSRGMRSVVRCFDGGCFKKGWTENRHFYPQNQTEWVETRCVGDDCLKHGWQSIGQYGRNDVRCENNDCNVWGWVTWIYPGSRQARTTCSLNKCFKYGWTTDVW